MGKIYFQEPPHNPVELEKALGLPQGAIKEMTSCDGKIEEISFNDTLVTWPDAVLKAKIEKLFARVTKD